MADPILGGEIHGRGLGGALGHEGVEGGFGPVGEEHRAGLRIQRLDVAHAVVLLVGPGELMLLDDAVEVFLAARRGDEAHLRVAAHDLAVEVEGRLAVELQRALADEAGEILRALGIDGVRIQVGAGGQVDLRLADVQEAEGISPGHFPGFFRRHDVVGQLADLRGELRLRTEGGKRFDGGHTKSGAEASGPAPAGKAGSGGRSEAKRAPNSPRG